MERINKYLARAGLGSRRNVEELIQKGMVKIDGETATLTSKVAENSTVAVNDEKISPKELVYLVINKPKGYITTLKDPYAKKKITDILPEEFNNLSPVGRLDKDTTGLLILTNDGDLAYRLTHPKHEKEKEYVVKAIPEPKEVDLDKLRKGILLEDGKTKPAKIAKEDNKISIIITEGRKRQIRRMFEAIGYKVTELKRIRIGSLLIGKLEEGEFRFLNNKEICDLKND
ncbi:TPA: pseudouridine synthase [candidate division CPR2 bacterium]|uniref:Pseudouridine synthase n=1 Tax=candidate division CPR2 bacterium GW2011_GWC1_41_48 TaxID=1618344 RepID=A0A0G0Z9W6_UNCC2|nr:MAG: Pseudouridine synthase [candidate division CPR2 bacterium GW2011_GWC2_39_35]KKR28007.1 MAG: Pseudouridine synthase [candidate division CPR2 bacterium GW2011_GWD2_39_7]KKR28415.1 MAG: Pseudouridine synthase [candidate division CPR2 bacterium GW2011_GWD1_39_7]KKS09838.1 MAG: Pseudouridine synthase [candidate division CPR2 bacterium GW2011_GWC1_41_48]OGB60675.1 MAG: hypothetical protein A2Y27_00560 [candidate division CPR2 bacterium GWD1_39_7]OGB72101.1 MAG: hypothetical protein A2Y26_050